MRFPKDFPDQLRSQISVSEVIGKKIALKKRGHEYIGLCPFHNEKSPSFSVNDIKGFYHCFGCAAHGDIITFVMQNEGLDFKEAVIHLADQNGITIPIIKDNQDYEKSLDQLDREYSLLEKACQFFENNLIQYNGAQALDYLHKRGIDKKNIQKFRLGFALNSYDSLINHLKNSGFSEAELLTSGVISKNDQQKLYDKFRGRIIFPILNKSGKIIAFGGRALGDEMPKYLNSSETNLFKKGSNLYNYAFARKTIYEKKFAVIVEGYMDAISLFINGIENVVAPLGTAVTEDQLSELFRITEDIVICLDGDEAGIKAMRRVIDIALLIINAKNNIRFTFLPNQMDPDDFIKSYGKNALEDLLKNAKNLSEVLFDFEAKDLGIKIDDQNIAPEKKAQLEAKLLAKINLIKDQNSKKHFAWYYKDRLFKIGKKIAAAKNITAQNKIAITDNPDLPRVYALSIIQMIINFPQLISQKKFDEIRNLHFDDEELSNLKEEIIDFIDHESTLDFSNLKSYIEKSFLSKKIKDKIFLDNKIFHGLDSASVRLQILILKYHHHQVSREYLDLLAKIDEVETDEVSIIGGKQKEIFDHKTFLEKQIQKLESEII